MAKKKVSQKEIAESLGLSPAAVSNILKGKGRFSEKTRNLVRKKLAAAGYEPRDRYRLNQLLLLPNPPPPGVMIRKRSPGCARISFLAPRYNFRPSL